MTAIPFVERLRQRNLDRFPEADRTALECLVQAGDEAAARIRGEFSYLEEPSNVFRLVAAKEKQA
jgi:hypothetical protein